MAQPMPAAPRQADLTGRRLGRYEVLTQLASGGMATVYVARRGGVAGFERLVAIKVLHPHLAHDEEFISMFLDEARLAARIRHPGVVATLDISDTQGDGFFLVMDYVEGDHLGHLLRAAAKGGEREQLVYESADLLYHLVVLWQSMDIRLAEVAEELASRRRGEG